MDIIIISLLMVINLMIIIGTTMSRDKYKSRCQQLKNYIKFIESAEPIEDAHHGAMWLNERADRRAETDIQDLN